MRSIQVQHYLQRATDFFNCMQVARGTNDFGNSSALLAIHSAVSFADALRVGLGDEQIADDDHSKAADRLSKRVPPGLRGSGGLEHLRYLLANKSAVAYGDRRVEVKTVDLLVLKAQRFAAWANETGRTLKIEGWQDGD